MTIETLDKVIHATPFKPFTIMLADGHSLPVPHPDLIAYNPKGRIAAVIDEHDRVEMVALHLIASLSLNGTGVTTEARSS